MRIVLDTNVVVSALFWTGPPRALLDLAYGGQVTAYTSDELVLELESVLGRPIITAFLDKLGVTPREISLRYTSLSNLLHPAKLPTSVCQDPDDDAILECALAAAATVVVSGDQHLLGLGTFRGVEIVPPAEILKRLAGSNQP
jgi:putative PIN family toxin of toxin-antitoxin system